MLEPLKLVPFGSEPFSASSKALPHAEIEIVLDTGHSLNIEKAGGVSEKMVRFLSKNYV